MLLTATVLTATAANCEEIFAVISFSAIIEHSATRVAEASKVMNPCPVLATAVNWLAMDSVAIAAGRIRSPGMLNPDTLVAVLWYPVNLLTVTETVAVEFKLLSANLNLTTSAACVAVVTKSALRLIVPVDSAANAA